MKLEKIRNENRFPILLFFILFLNYIPLFLINYNVKTSNAVNVKEMTICFGIECILLIFFLFKKSRNIFFHKIQFHNHLHNLPHIPLLPHILLRSILRLLPAAPR